MKNILFVVQILISISLIILVLIQAKGVGLGHAWGGGGDFYKSRRGVEKLVFRLTLIVSFIFFTVSVLNLLS